MATQPLPQFRPFNIDMPDPLAAQSRVMSVQDAFSQRKARDQQLESGKLGIEAGRLNLDKAKLQLSAAEKLAAEDEFEKTVIAKHSKWDDETGYSLDLPGAIQELGSKLPERALALQTKEEELKKKAAAASIETWKAHADTFKQLGSMFGDDAAANERAYMQIPPQVKQALDLPAKFSPEAVEYARSMATRLQTQAERKTAAEISKIEQETAASKTQSYAPGTLIITRDKDGKEISRETVQAKEDKESDKAKEVAKIEAAYAMAKGIKPEKMTALDQVKAVQWYNQLDPDRATEFDKRLALYRSDPKTYEALYGHGDDVDKDLTKAQKATILGRIDTQIASLKGSGSLRKPGEAEAYKKEKLAELKAAGISLDDVKPAAPAPAGRAAKRADIIAAGKKAGVSDADAIKRWTDAGNTISP